MKNSGESEKYRFAGNFRLVHMKKTLFPPVRSSHIFHAQSGRGGSTFTPELVVSHMKAVSLHVVVDFKNALYPGSCDEISESRFRTTSSGIF